MRPRRNRHALDSYRCHEQNRNMAVETIGEAWSLGWRLHVRCASGKGDGLKKHRECPYSAELDMDTLMMSKGPSFPLVKLSSPLFCPQCHQTRMRVLFTPSAETFRAAAARTNP